MTNEIMLRDILSQGDALGEGLGSLREGLSTAQFPTFRRIVLTGSGDSFIAAVAMESLFHHHLPVPVLALPSLDASRYRSAGPADLVVAISVSGEAARTIEVAHRARAAGAGLVAVTAAGSSTLARSCDVVMTIPTPIDRSIPHSRDYSVTLLALGCLLERLIRTRLPELDRLPALVSQVVTRSFETVAEVPGSTGRSWFLGAGPDRATAMFGALKYWEAAGMESWWDELEEFGHGSQLMARPGDRAVLIAAGPGCQRAVEMIPGLEAMGLDILLVGGSEMNLGVHPHLPTADDLDPRWHPFVSSVPLGVLTYAEANDRDLDVSIPLYGHAHGPAFDRVHVEWTRKSRIVLGGGSPA